MAIPEAMIKSDRVKGIIQAAVFETDLCWLVLAGYCRSSPSSQSPCENHTVLRLLFGGDTKNEAKARWQNEIETAPWLQDWRSSESDEVCYADWYPACRKKLQKFCCGQVVDFSAVRCDLTSMTPFQQDVLNTARGIPSGKVLRYGELARQIGRPQASRAVGAALGRNPVPLIIPCHRIIGTNGKLTGFTAPGGVQLKHKLLQMEQP